MRRFFFLIVCMPWPCYSLEGTDFWDVTKQFRSNRQSTFINSDCCLLWVLCNYFAVLIAITFLFEPFSSEAPLFPWVTCSILTLKAHFKLDVILKGLRYKFLSRSIWNWEKISSIGFGINITSSQKYPSLKAKTNIL